MQVGFRCGSIKKNAQSTTFESLYLHPMKDILRHLIFFFCLGGKNV